MQQQKNQNFSLTQVIQKLRCSRHDEAFVLVCIEKQCQAQDRLFCMECNDESQLGKKSHILISVKKFQLMYNKFNPHLKDERKTITHQKFKKLRANIESNLTHLEKVLSSEDSSDIREGEQEQIVKGKINNILNHSVWNEVLEMQNKKLSEENIGAYVKKSFQKRNSTIISVLENLQKSLISEIQKNLNIIVSGDLNLLRTTQFSQTRKHKDIRLTADCKTVCNVSEYGNFLYNRIGHYFALAQRDFDVENSTYKFKLGPVSQNVTYWLGFTFPSVSQKSKWTNIYDARMGSYCIAIYQSGNQINFWSNEKEQKEALKYQKIKSFDEIQLSIQFQKKILQFSLLSGGKSSMIKAVKPDKWFGKIYPVVGFFGKQGTISIL